MIKFKSIFYILFQSFFLSIIQGPEFLWPMEEKKEPQANVALDLEKEDDRNVVIKKITKQCINLAKDARDRLFMPIDNFLIGANILSTSESIIKTTNIWCNDFNNIIKDLKINIIDIDQMIKKYVFLKLDQKSLSNATLSDIRSKCVLNTINKLTPKFNLASDKILSNLERSVVLYCKKRAYQRINQNNNIFCQQFAASITEQDKSGKEIDLEHMHIFLVDCIERKAKSIEMQHCNTDERKMARDVRHQQVNAIYIEKLKKAFGNTNSKVIPFASLQSICLDLIANPIIAHMTNHIKKIPRNTLANLNNHLKNLNDNNIEDTHRQARNEFDKMNQESWQMYRDISQMKPIIEKMGMHWHRLPGELLEQLQQRCIRGITNKLGLMEFRKLFTPKSLKAAIDVTFESKIRRKIMYDLEKNKPQKYGEQAIIAGIKQKALHYTDIYALKNYDPADKKDAFFIGMRGLMKRNFKQQLLGNFYHNPLPEESKEEQYIEENQPLLKKSKEKQCTLWHKITQLLYVVR
jgi:hypothetical protein